MNKGVDMKTVFDVSASCLQKEFAELIGVSERSVRDMVKRQVIGSGQNLKAWLHRYCSHLREQAASRAAKGGLDLAGERAALAREQRIRIEMQNAVTRREYGPRDEMELGLSDLMARVAAKLDTIPGKLKIASNKLTADDLNLVASVIANVSNEIANTEIDWFGDHPGDSDDIDIEL